MTLSAVIFAATVAAANVVPIDNVTLKGSSTFNLGRVHSIPKPERVSAGDLLLAIVVTDGANSNLTAASGLGSAQWTIKTTIAVPLAQPQAKVWVLSRIAEINEPLEYTYATSSVGPNGVHAVITAWSGITAADPIADVIPSFQSGLAVYPPSPGLRSGLFVFSAIRRLANDTTTWTTPVGMVERANENAIAVFESLTAITSGANTVPTPANNNSEPMLGLTMVLREALTSIRPNFKSKSEARLVFPVPMTTQPGDLLVLQLRTDSAATDVVNGDAWKVLGRKRLGDGTVGLWLWRIAPLGLNENWVSFKNVGTTTMAGTVLAFGGADPAAPFGPFNATVGSGPQISFPSIDRDVGGVTILGLMSKESLSGSSVVGATLIADAGSVLAFQTAASSSIASFSTTASVLASSLVIRGPGIPTVADAGVLDAGLTDPNVDSGSVFVGDSGTDTDAGASMDASIPVDAGTSIEDAGTFDGGSTDGENDQPDGGVGETKTSPEEINFVGYGCQQGADGVLLLGLFALTRRRKRKTLPS